MIICRCAGEQERCVGCKPHRMPYPLKSLEACLSESAALQTLMYSGSELFSNEPGEQLPACRALNIIYL
jgi:hypothetical protein